MQSIKKSQNLVLISNSKKGKFNVNLIQGITIFLILLAVLMTIFSETVPLMQSAASNISDEGVCASIGCNWNGTLSACEVNSSSNVTCSFNEIPMGNLFNRTSVVVIIVMAGILVMILSLILKKKLGEE